MFALSPITALIASHSRLINYLTVGEYPTDDISDSMTRSSIIGVTNGVTD